MSMMGAIEAMQLEWYAVKLKARQNGGRRQTVLGVEYETYRARNGRMCRRKVKGSGTRVFVPELLLRGAGFEVFLPIRKEWVTVSRFSPEKELRSFPAMEGWLFVGFPAGQNRFLELMQMDVVAGVMGADGLPIRISDAKVRFMMRKFGNRKHRQVREAVQDARIPAGNQVRFAAGDLVRVDAGPFEGHDVRIHDVQRGSVSAVLKLLGKDTEVEIPEEILVPVQSVKR